MGRQKVDGKGHLHVNVPVALWEKLRVMSQLSTSVANSSELAQVAMDAFAGISRALDANGFAAVERQRKKNEAWQSVMLFVDEATIDAAKNEADRLGVSVSSWITTAVSAMMSEVNPMIYAALRKDFAQTMRKWKQGFGPEAKVKRLCSGEPTVN